MDGASVSVSLPREHHAPPCALGTCFPLLLAQIQHNDADVLPQLARVGELPAALGALQAAGDQAALRLRGQRAVRTQANEVLCQLLFSAGLLRGPLRPASLPLHDQKLYHGNKRAQYSHMRRQCRAYTQLPNVGLGSVLWFIKNKRFETVPEINSCKQYL